MISLCVLYFFSSGLQIVIDTEYTLSPEFRYAGLDSMSSMRIPSRRSVVTKSCRWLLLVSSR